MRTHKGKVLLALAIGVGMASLYTPSAPVFAEAELSNPHRIVSSDGKFEGMAPEAGLTDEPSFEGSDYLPEVGLAESAEDVWRLWSLRGLSGPGSTESILAPDQRVRNNPTTTYPRRAAVLITFTGGRCSGAMINATTVSTAGHCVHTGGPGGVFRNRASFRIYPGRNGNLSPYGVCTAKRLSTVVGWANSSDDRYDYGAIKLNCSIGNTTGWFGYFWTSASLLGLQTNIYGYPGDKPLQQWRSLNNVTVSQTQRTFYKNDTIGGDSGAPVFYNRPGCGQCEMAIHAYGIYNGPPFNTNNHGTRVNQSVFNNLTAWKNAP